MTIGWVTAFVDVPHGGHRRAVDFWCAVTGASESSVRGDRGQFSTAVPREGEAYLRFQDTGDEPARVHVDLHVPDVDAAADAALGLGAVDLPSPSRVRIQRSPGGLVYCFVELTETGLRPPAPRWPYACELDQVCLDIPPAVHDREVAFWRDLTDWSPVEHRSPEFTGLAPPGDQPLRFLLQRLDDDAAAVTAHLDLACADVPAEIGRHVALGATSAYPGRGWHTMIDPAGSRYCLTGRTPH